MNKVTDGRFRRTESTRQNILNVSRELILAGNLEPTARDIADTAGITPRTLFRHFPDMQALYRSLIEQAEGGAADVMNEPFAIDPHDSWRDCLSLVIDRRVAAGRDILIPLPRETHVLLDIDVQGAQQLRESLTRLHPRHPIR